MHCFSKSCLDLTTQNLFNLKKTGAGFKKRSLKKCSFFVKALMIIDGLPFSYLIEKTNKQLEIMPNDS